MNHHSHPHMKTEASRLLYEEAKHYIPGGVNSPVRAFQAVGGHPLFIQAGRGSRIRDVDGNEFIDYVCSWGPLILGHCHPRVMEAVEEAVKLGTSFGAPTPGEVSLARRICEAVPSIESVRLVNSGTEAVMSAIRLARAYSRRDKILKFAGGYHGHMDALLASAGSGIATLGLPGSPGVPPHVVADTIVVPYNDLEAVKTAFERYKEEIACVIVEPVAGNMGVVPPIGGFLEGLREITSHYKALLIFDEVITGFRLSYGGAQALFGIQPDLTTLGKIIGAGFPVGAYGGRKEIMQMVAPAGPVYQAGTLSGNPVAVSAGLAVLEVLHNSEVYERLESVSAVLEEGLRKSAEEAGLKVTINRMGSMFTLFFTPDPVTDFASASRSNKEQYAHFFWEMLHRGVYFAPSQFEANFVSLAHSDEDIAATIAAARQAFHTLAQKS